MYEDLQTIVQLGLAKQMDAVAQQTRAKLQEAQAHFAATQGAVIRSGHHEASLGRIRIAAAEQLVHSLFELWVNLITERNGQIKRNDISFILAKLDELSRAQTQNLLRTFTQARSGVSITLSQEVHQRMYGAVGRARRDLEIMVRKNEVLPKKPLKEKQTVVHLNIQNSNIGNLNLGSQVGIINTALESISSGGGNQQEFANAIKELTEAIVSQKELKDDHKREAVQALSTVAAEAQKKAEERSTGTLKAIMAYLPSLISSASQLEALWENVGPTIKSYLGL